MRHWRTPGRRNEKGGDQFYVGEREPRPTSLEMFHAHGKCCGLSTRFRWTPEGGEWPRHESGSLLRSDRSSRTRRGGVIEERSDWEFLGVWERLRPGPHIRATRLHLPNRVIFSSAWRHRKTQARNRRRSSSSRMLSMTLSRLKRLTILPRLFTMHRCAPIGSVRAKVGSIVVRERISSIY